MWLAYTFASAVFAGATSILAKVGVKEVDATLATALRTVVVPIDKLSILVTVAFAWLFFGEKLSKKALLGLCCMVAGTLLLLVA